jgi:hypothetical protein
MPLADYAHWNEDAEYMWWHEEGKHEEYDPALDDPEDDEWWGDDDGDDDDEGYGNSLLNDAYEGMEDMEG